MAVETELKLRISPAHMARLRRHPFLRSLSSGRPQSRRLYNVYFDTPDRYLHQHAMALRLRRSGRQWLQTLKGGGGVQAGLHQRNEWEMPVPGDALQLEALEQAGGMPLPGKVRKALRAEFVTDFTRSVRTLNFSGAVIELGMDSGVIKAGRRTHTISELELELKAGQPAQLFELALALQEIVPLEVEGISKAEYGYRLRDGVQPEVARAGAVVLQQDATLAQALQGMIWSCLAQLQDNVPGAVARLGDEYLHQIRVSLRRLRVLLGMAAAVQEDAELASLRQALADLSVELGKLREWDVFVGATLPPARAQLAGLADMGGLIRYAEGMRRRQYMQTRRCLQAQGFQRLLLRFGAWMLGGYWTQQAWQDEAGGKQTPLHQFARAVLRRHSKRTHRLHLQLAQAPSPEQLHRLRIACKKLRYSAELFASLYRHHGVKRYLASLSAVQDMLGYLNDIHVARRLLAQVGSGKRHETCVLIQGWVEHDYARHLQALRKVWRQLERQPEFWAA
ncbi:MAG TPA: CHAD domain-containing protein [Gallionellaceae bacterium]